MEFHHLVSPSKPRRLDPPYLGVQIVHGEANVVEPELRQVRDVRVRQRLGSSVSQDLDLVARCRARERESACSASMPGTPMRVHLRPGDEPAHLLIRGAGQSRFDILATIVT